MKNFRASGIYGSLAAVTCIMLTGCGGPSNPKTYPVTGTVTYRDAPVADAVVAFFATTEEAHAAAGRTDAQGRYTLTTFEQGDGAVPGTYKVRVFKYDTPTGAIPGQHSGPADEENYVPPDEQAAPPPAPKHLLPEIYFSTGRTPLSFTVDAVEQNVYDITLEDR